MPIEVDTIAAISTPEGLGAVALVRLTGPDATRVVESLLAADASLPAPRRPAVRELLDPEDGTLLDRALVTRFEGPASYTGEDLIELSCHGGRVVPHLVLEACLAVGARRAEPGEFTRRAYLHGKLDLVQVEAIADVIEARSRALHRAAIHQLDRNLSSRVSALRERIVHIEALLAHHVDFPEEDDAPVELGRVVEEAGRLLAELKALLATAPEGELLRAGAVVVLAGAPNAGKSSLYNALIGDDRALVTPEAGTTRDALEAEIQMGGYPFRIVDTAGIRDEATGIERLGIEVAERYLKRAHAVLFCVPAGTDPEVPAAVVEAIEPGTAVVLVRTKADLAGRGGYDAGNGEIGEPDDVLGAGPVGLDADADPAGPAERAWDGRVEVSAVTGSGLGALRSLLAELVYGRLSAIPIDAPVLTRRRHARALASAATEVEGFMIGVEEGLPAEVAATHLRSAETALEELLGVVSVDDVLDVVFRDFCIGK